MTPGEIYARCARAAARWCRSTTRAAPASPSSRPRSRARTSSTTSRPAPIYGDYENADVPNDWLRLPGESLWSDQFNGLEIWNGFASATRTATACARTGRSIACMHDWLEHAVARPLRHAGRRQRHPHDRRRTRSACRARTSASPTTRADALASGTAVDAVLADADRREQHAARRRRHRRSDDRRHARRPAGARPRDRRRPPDRSRSTSQITSPDWAEFDTLEVFANTTPDASQRRTTTRRSSRSSAGRAATLVDA